MKRILGFCLAAILVTACDHPSPTALPSRPQMAISDGAHGGTNPDFFFLPPLVPDPSNNPNFDAGKFNPLLSPVVRVCTWNGSACGATVAEFTTTSGLGSETIRVNTTDQHYIVNWHTDLSNLDPSLTYRILVSVGSKQLGFADVDVVSTGKQLRNVNTNEFIGLVDGRTLPIKFRIETGALCDPPGTPVCASQTIVLADGGAVVLGATGDRIDIPPQTSGQVVTVTLQLCDGIDVDLKKFGNCLRITSDPALTQPLSPLAIVSMCSLL